MTAQNPNMREDLNTATPQRVADLLRSVRSGDLLAGLVQNGVLHGRRQAAVVALVGASPHAFTFEDLDMLPPAAVGLGYGVVVQGETAARVTVDESTKTLLGFSILGGADTEVVTIEVIEPVSEPVEVVAVAADVGALSRAAALVLDVVAVEGLVALALGRKELLIGDASVVPAAGQVVWDRGTGLRFAPDDAVSSARVVSLPLASPLTLSLLERTLQQRD